MNVLNFERERLNEAILNLFFESETTMKHCKRTCALCCHTQAIVTETERISEHTGNRLRVYNLTRASIEAKHALQLAELAMKRDKRLIERSRDTMRAIRLDAYKNRSQYHVDTLLRIA